MTAATPYRTAPDRNGAPPRAVVFLPRLRLLLLLLLLAAGAAAVTALPRRPTVTESWIGCDNTVAAALTNGEPERYDTPIATCWCQVPTGRRGATPHRFACELAAPKVAEIAAKRGSDETITVRIHPDQRVLSETEAMERLRACRQGAPAGACSLDVQIVLESPPSNVPVTLAWIASAAALLAAALFSTKARVQVDVAAGLVQVREARLFRRMQDTVCVLGQIRSVVDHRSGFAFLLADGSYFPLTEQDDRPAFLRARTLARLQGLLEEARAGGG